MDEVLDADTLSSIQASFEEKCANVFANADAMEYASFEDIIGQHSQFDNNYFDGGTEWNDDIESDTEQIEVQMGNALRFIDIAEEKAVAWPNYITNFDNCELRAVMCCFTGQRFPDADIEMNAEVCALDLSEASKSNHLEQGIAVYDTEPGAYCNGFAWSDAPHHVTNRYKANTLFHVSMIDGTFNNGYVENIPGAPMCACLEQMPSVSNSECTEPDVHETFSISYKPDTKDVEISFSGADISFKSCEDNLLDYHQQLRGDSDISTHITENCTGPTQDALNSAFYTPGTPEALMDPSKWHQVVGKGDYFKNPTTETQFRALIGSYPDYKLIRRLCKWCSTSHQDIYYKRITEIPGMEELDFLDLFMDNWFDSISNTLNVDFELYGSLEDAETGQNKWTFCNYNDPTVGFPRDCGPTGYKASQWNAMSRYRGQSHWAFSVEVDGPQLAF